jgi:hypothetical protein
MHLKNICLGKCIIDKHFVIVLRLEYWKLNECDGKLIFCEINRTRVEYY